MRLTTKFSAFVTLLTGLTIFVTLLGCSLSFYNAIQYKFSHRVQAVATAIDTHLVSNDFSVLRPQITELMMSADIVRVDLLHTRMFGNKVYIDLEISVDGNKTFREAHAVAESVHANVEKKFPNTKHIMIHVNPTEE